MSNLVLRFSYQVKRKHIGFSIGGSWNELCRQVTRTGSHSNLSELGLGFISLCVPVKMLGFSDIWFM